MTPIRGHPEQPTASTRTASSSSTRRCATASSRPGISLNAQEKLEIAHQLARLGVDVIEAGFPITSPGDCEARWRRSPRRSRARSSAAWPARRRRTSTPPGTRSSTPSGRASTPSSRPRTSTSSASSRRPARTCWARRAPPSHTPSSTATTSSSRPRTAAAPTSSSWPRSCRPRSRRARPRSTSPTPSATRCRTSTREIFRELYRLVPELKDVVVSVHCHDDLGLAVANSFAGLTAGARQVECAVNGIGERAGNASLEEIVMLLRTRRSSVGLDTGLEHARDRAHEPAGVAPHRLPGAAEQGDRGPQRVRARGRHPPGRRAEGPHHLRDHGRDHDRPADELDRAGQALRPPRAAQRAGGAGRAGRRPGPEHGLQALQGDRGPQEARDRAGPRGDRLGRDPRAGGGLQPRLVRAARRLGHARRPRRSRSTTPDRRDASRARAPATARSTRCYRRSTPRPASPAC